MKLFPARGKSRMTFAIGFHLLLRQKNNISHVEAQGKIAFGSLTTAVATDASLSQTL
jgi:hypothetical protein